MLQFKILHSRITRYEILQSKTQRVFNPETAIDRYKMALLKNEWVNNFILVFLCGVWGYLLALIPS